MLRNDEPWDLGEPSTNDSGQPAIHDIVSKLGCIRDSPDLPTEFPENAHDFADLRRRLQAEEDDALVKDDKYGTEEDDCSASHAHSLSSPESESSCHSPSEVALDSYSYLTGLDPTPETDPQAFGCSKPTPLDIASMPSFGTDEFEQSFDASLGFNLSPFTDAFQNSSLGPPGPLAMLNQYSQFYPNLAVDSFPAEMDVWKSPVGTIQPNLLDTSARFDVYL